MTRIQTPRRSANDQSDTSAWEVEALGQHGIPVLQRAEQLKNNARRLAGRNDFRCFLLLLEERVLNDLIVDMTSTYLDMERVGSHIQAGKYKVGQTETDFYRTIVH